MTRAEMVGGLLLRDDLALLVHRSPSRRMYPDRWSFPGGHVEPGESGEAALVRELAEELGVEVAPPGGPAALDVVTAEYRLRVWIVTSWEGVPWNAEPAEHDDLRWFGLAAVGEIDVIDPMYRELLMAALQG